MFQRSIRLLLQQEEKESKQASQKRETETVRERETETVRERETERFGPEYFSSIKKTALTLEFDYFALPFLLDLKPTKDLLD